VNGVDNIEDFVSANKNEVEQMQQLGA